MVTGVEQDDAASDAVATSGSSGAGASSSGSSGGITVTTADGGNFTAHYALLTVSLGVLKEGDLDFQPPLPPSKLQAIEEMVGGRVGRQGAVFVVGVVGTGKGERESPSSTFPFANGSKRQARFFFPIERVFFSPSSGACLSLSLFTLPSSENSPMTRVTTLTSRACPTVFFVCVERACTE